MIISEKVWIKTQSAVPKVTAPCAKGSDNEKNENNVKYTRLIFIITQI